MVSTIAGFPERVQATLGSENRQMPGAGALQAVVGTFDSALATADSQDVSGPLGKPDLAAISAVFADNTGVPASHFASVGRLSARRPCAMTPGPVHCPGRKKRIRHKKLLKPGRGLGRLLNRTLPLTEVPPSRVQNHEAGGMHSGGQGCLQPYTFGGGAFIEAAKHSG
jgi:hypothetical protein